MRYVKFVNYVTITLSDEQNKSCRYWWVVQLLCSWLFHLKLLSTPKFCLKLSFVEIQNLNYSNLATWKDDQNKSCRSWWVLQLLFSWLFQFKSFGVSKCCLNLPFLEIQNLNCSNQITWKDDQNKSCRSWWFLELCSWQHFHLKSFYHGKLRLNFLNLKFEFFKRSRMEKRPK